MESKQTFLETVVDAMEQIAPLSLAYKGDNAGLQLEAYSPRTTTHVLLTADVTLEIAKWCEDKDVSVIVSYHPLAISGFKRWSLKENGPLSACARLGISVYAPHTAMDSVQNGINDWIAGKIGAGLCVPIIPSEVDPGSGMGRLLTLDKKLHISDVAHVLLKAFDTKNYRFMPANSGIQETTYVTRVGICAGSASGFIEPMFGMDVELLVCGECSYHALLKAKSFGISVLLFEHVVSENNAFSDILLGGGRLINMIRGAYPDVKVSKYPSPPITINYGSGSSDDSNVDDFVCCRANRQ